MNEWVIESNKTTTLDPENTAEALFLGDVALAGQVGDAIMEHGSAFLFDQLPRAFFTTDIVCYNLECCLSRRGQVWEPKPVPFRGLPEFLAVFPETGCRYVANLANNHFLDYGEEAALDTVKTLTQHGVATIGAAGRTVGGPYTVVKSCAGKLGLISFAPSVHPLPGRACINVPVEQVSDMVRQVSELRQQSDVVVVSLHQGVENTPYVDRRCRQLTHRLVDAGADCIVCHHPHIIQAIELYKGVHIFHSIGNFVIGVDFARFPGARRSLALKLTLSGGRLARIHVTPFVITDSLQPRPATDEENREIRDETSVLSSMLASPLGSYTGHLRCEAHKMCDRASSLLEMMRRKGIVVGMRYCAGRLAAKTGHGVRVKL